MMRPLLFAILLMLSTAPALGVPVYHTFSDPVFAERLPGADGFLGTADDIAAAGRNTIGTASYVEFRNVAPIVGTSFFSFGSGTLSIDQPLVSLGGEVRIEQFTLLLTNSQTNGFASQTINLASVLPHEIVYQSGGTLVARYTLRSISSGILDTDVVLTGYQLAPGVDPASLPGIDQATADYLTFLTTVAPTGWTRISLVTRPMAALDASNTRGSLAGYVIGGSAGGVSVLYTTDPINVAAPETSLIPLLALGLFPTLLRDRKR